MGARFGRAEWAVGIVEAFGSNEGLSRAALCVFGVI